MANRRNRIIYASQSVFAEGRILYRIQTFGSSTTFNTTDMFQIGQLNLTDVVDDAPEVTVTLEGMDYGSIYTMATLAKVPTHNLNDNIRQIDGLTFTGEVNGEDTSTGDIGAGPQTSGSTGSANVVVRDVSGGNALRYFHGVYLPDFGKECVPGGLEIYSPIQGECSLGTANADVDFTKYLSDVFVNSMDLSYSSDDTSSENYGGETETKTWLLNSARFVSWEEWLVGDLADQFSAVTMNAKTELTLALDTANTVATLEDTSLAFMKRDETGQPAVHFRFARLGGLTQPEVKLVPVFNSVACIPSNVVEYFIYDSITNELQFFANGLADSLDEVLPAGRASFETGDKISVVYAADAFADESAKEATYVNAKYFAPIGTEDVEDIGGTRQGQVEIYLVDPDLILSAALTGATILADEITFNDTVANSIDLTNFIGLPVVITAGPGVGGPAREIVAASNVLAGDYNNGTLTLGGADWASISLSEDLDQVSTASGVFVADACSVTAEYVGSDIEVAVSGSLESSTIAAVVGSEITLAAPLSDVADDGGQVLVSAEPTVNSTMRIGDYELSLRLQSVDISADLSREALKELGHLDPYARPLTLPIEFTVAMETTAGDLELFAKFAGKENKYKAGTLTDLDLADLLAKDNMVLVAQIYQQTDKEAGGNGRNRRVLAPDMFGDEYYVDGVREVYSATDGSLREYPLKTVVLQDLRPTDEEYSLAQGDNATQSFSYRGTNSLAVVRGFIDVDYVVKVIESQGE